MLIDDGVGRAVDRAVVDDQLRDVGARHVDDERRRTVVRAASAAALPAGRASVQRYVSAIAVHVARRAAVERDDRRHEQRSDRARRWRPAREFRADRAPCRVRRSPAPSLTISCATYVARDVDHECRLDRRRTRQRRRAAWRSRRERPLVRQRVAVRIARALPSSVTVVRHARRLVGPGVGAGGEFSVVIVTVSGALFVRGHRSRSAAPRRSPARRS